MKFSVTDSRYRDHLYEKSSKAQQKAKSLRKSSDELQVTSSLLITETKKMLKSLNLEHGFIIQLDDDSQDTFRNL